MSKATARCVGFSFFSSSEEHRDEAVDRVGVLALPVHETVDRQGVERAERERMAVDDQEGRLCFVRHPVSLAGRPTGHCPSGRRSSKAALTQTARPERDAAFRTPRRRRPRREDGDRVPRVERRARRGADAGRGQHPTLRAPARRGVRRPRRDPRLHRGELYAGPGRLAMGIEINATHSRSATTGWVTGICTPIHLGRTLTTHQIVITDDQGGRCSTVRITNFLKDAPRPEAERDSGWRGDPCAAASAAWRARCYFLARAAR